MARISGRACHALFAFDLRTAVIHLCQYLQGVIVTASFHTHINTQPGTLHRQPRHAQETLRYQKVKRQQGRQWALHQGGVQRTPCDQGFPTFFSRLWENMEGLSLLFTQLDPWKGLLNMKFDKSNEVTGRHKGRNPSGRKGGGGEGE